jgi:HEAT repeat protein
MSAVWGLQSYPDRGAVPLLGLILKTENVEIQAAALEVLGLCGSMDAISLVRDAVLSPHADVQYAATLSWVELAQSACFEEIAEIIKTVNGKNLYPILRGLFHASNYMGIEVDENILGGEKLLLAVERATKDELPAVRLMASMILSSSHQDRAGEILLGAFRAERDSNTGAHILNNAVNLMSPVAELMLNDAVKSTDVLIQQTGMVLKERKLKKSAA